MNDNTGPLSKVRCRIISLTILFILMMSILSLPGILYSTEGGKYGDIEPLSPELQLLAKINENRSQNGADPLKLNATLWWVSRAHCQDMIDHDFFDHPSSEEGPFNGASFSERVKNYAEYENGYIGECIAWNSWGIDPEWCMSAWKNSAGHWNIIINPNFNEIGIGILVGEFDGYSNCAFYTADFGGHYLSVDLSVSDTDIQFSPISPQEGDNVEISAKIHNLGDTDAYPVKVKFYDGDPDSDGSQIGDEQEILHILIQNEYATVRVNWDTTGDPGSHDIYVVVDRDNIIDEIDETNNKAYQTLVIDGGSPPPPPPISLIHGWNLISFPYVVSDTSFDQVLSSIQGKYDIVQCYDSSDSSDPWKNHHTSKPSSMNDLTDLHNNMGFWIHITDPEGAELSLDGMLPTSPLNITLKKGWNLVGYPSSTSKTRANGLNNLDFGTEIDMIMYYSSDSSSWETMNHNDHFEAEYGYWVHTTQDCIWIVQN